MSSASAADAPAVSIDCTGALPGHPFVRGNSTPSDKHSITTFPASDATGPAMSIIVTRFANLTTITCTSTGAAAVVVRASVDAFADAVTPDTATYTVETLMGAAGAGAGAGADAEVAVTAMARRLIAREFARAAQAAAAGAGAGDVNDIVLSVGTRRPLSLEDARALCTRVEAVLDAQD